MHQISTNILNNTLSDVENNLDGDTLVLSMIKGNPEDIARSDINQILCVDQLTNRSISHDKYKKYKLKYINLRDMQLKK